MLPPLTGAQVKTVNTAARQFHKQTKLAVRFDRADTRRQKRKLVAKDEKLDKAAKKTIKDWRREDLPTKPTDPGAGEPYPLHALFETAKLEVGRSLLWWADCLSGGGLGYCEQIPCNPSCAVLPIGAPGHRALVERRPAGRPHPGGS